MTLSFFKKIGLGLVAVVLAAMTAAAESVADDDMSYRPNIHGTLRPRYELLTGDGESRFQMRNARVSLDGRVAPQIDYFMQVDLCAKGKVMPLDFWARLALAPGLKLQAGQFRMPFGIDTFRAPHTFLFANRAFMVRDMCNYRAVGFKLTYAVASTPLSVEGGVFNPYAIGNHEVWSKKMNYAAKLVYARSGATLSTGIMSICPDRVRANLAGFSAGWGDRHWTVQGEFMHEHYTHRAHKSAWGYTAFANYGMPVKAGMFNRLSFQGRFDGITDHSSAYDTDGTLITDNPARNRITIGSTISYIRTAGMFVDIRLNYEKFFYHKGVEAPAGQNDKVVAELVVRF